MDANILDAVAKLLESRHPTVRHWTVGLCKTLTTDDFSLRFISKASLCSQLVSLLRLVP
jgi:hypothetical protein